MTSNRIVKCQNSLQEQDVVNETSTLLDQAPSPESVWTRRYRSTHKCVSSKAALVVLLWSFIEVTVYELIYNPAIGMYYSSVIVALYGGNAIILCFYPLAGFLADNKCGRYKTIVRSIHVLLAVLLLAVIGAAVFIPILMFTPFDWYYAWNNKICYVALSVGVILLIPSTIGLVFFNANVIQFGMDQLHDSPGDHQSLFIHWYVWLCYLGLLISQILWSTISINTYNIERDFINHFYIIDIVKFILNIKIGLSLLLLVLIVSVILSIVSLCMAHHKQRWFLIDPARPNPYQLVYRVTKFARQHKVPVHRSAFTYCEDEVPSGLDLGKDKYGGPFTTEQVEDVKAFYGVLKVLFALGPVFFLSLPTDPLLYYYAVHETVYFNFTLRPDLMKFNYNNNKILMKYLLQDGLLSSILIVVCVPLYICLLRPFVSKYIPGMLKRMGLSFVLMITSAICTFLMDTAAHVREKNVTGCMFTFNIAELTNNSTTPVFQNVSLLIVQRSLSSLSNMLLYIALYEFICSQSPHSMKGLLIGISFAIKGVFQTFSAAVATPFFIINILPFPSCGMYYYLVNIVVGLVALLVYVCVARRYKFRERDEPCNVQRYVEDYYSKIQQERFYDYYD